MSTDDEFRDTRPLHERKEQRPRRNRATIEVTAEMLALNRRIQGAKRRAGTEDAWAEMGAHTWSTS